MAKDVEAEGVALKVLITAEEGFPELERLFLAAEREIWAGFRIFDLDTGLRSDEARAIGATWFDLLVHRLRAGVRVHFLLADFDPCLATSLHAGAARSARRFAEAAAASGSDRLRFAADLHPACAGAALRLIFWPFVLRKLRRSLAKRADLRGLLAWSKRLRPRVSLGPDGGPRIAALPVPGIHPATHHQKLAVFDRRTLFIGGLDVDERRYDTKEHDRPAAFTWHDVAVVTGGPAALAAQAHLEAIEAGAPPPAAAPPFLRTQSRDSRNPFRLSPVTVIREIEDAHRALFARAERLIYLESQYFRSIPLARALERAARDNPAMTLILMLPAAPEEVAFEKSRELDTRFGEYLQARCLRRIRRAFGARAFIGMPLRPVARDADDRETALGADIIYIHSKIAIADDAEAIVSSANLNGRSLRWDTEAGLLISDPVDTAHLRRRLFAHWLPEDAEDDLFDAASACGRWAALAAENASRQPEERRGFVAPFDPKPAEEFGVPAPVPDEVV